MGTYLVERYLPGIGQAGLLALADRLRTASADLRADGIEVRYLGSLFLPEEEACFCQLEAPTTEEVKWLNERANAPYARISTAVVVGAGPG
jgi:hypothetical protein